MLQGESRTPELSILNRRPSIIEGPVLLHELVRLSSDTPAIDFLEDGSKRRKFDYKTLHALSNTLAEKIVRVSAKLGSSSSIIPVLLPQCPELYIALLAVLKTGKAFCPVSLDTPAERLNFILQDIAADLLVTLSTCDEKIRATTGVRALFVDRELSERNDQSQITLPQASTNDLAYVLYTSGSTGLPKAVSVSHRAVTQSLLAHNRHIPHFARFLQFAAPTFDVSIFEIFFPWFRGRTLVGCTRAHMLDDLPGTISNLDVDAAELTPTVVGNLLQGRSSVPGLKLLLTIGEMLTQHVIDEYGGDENKESILWAMYGPTEAAIHCTLQARCSASSSVGTIGYPLDTVSIFIITPISESASTTVLPVGEVGELAIGGPQIAEEYLNRPDLTSASFIEHPDHGRLYRTGDRARLRNDGCLECLGRVVAGQVKLRGQRVELGEVEEVIMRMDGCRTATVMVIEQMLVVFCASGSRKLSRSDVLEHCRRWLPGFMIPSDICFVQRMPQLPSGKIDRGSLETSYLATPHQNGTHVSGPDDHVGLAVSRILKHYTEQDLALDANLASAGLDSLQSIRIASALRQEGFNLGAIDILSAVTLGDLIAACKDCPIMTGIYEKPNTPTDTSADTNISEFKRQHTDIACILPCTPLQEAMLAETIARPSAYCNWIEVELSMLRTYDEIRDALQSLAQTNDILRTGFSPVSQNSGTFDQIVWKGLLDSQIREVVNFFKNYSLESDQALLRPFNVQVKMSPERPRLLFQIHHALYDGWSFDLLLHDFDKQLHGRDIARRPQFRDVVRYFTRELRPGDQASAKDYWANLLSDHIPTVLPNYNGKVVHESGVCRSSGRSAVESRLLHERARQLAVNPQVFFQAATAFILGLYTGSSDVVFGNVTSGRTIPVTGVEDIVGPCIASLPFRLDFEGLFLVRDILHKVQSMNRDGLQHCVLPLREIARAANVRPGTRLFDVLFVWQQSLNSASNSSLAANIVDSADDLEFKITLEFEPREDYIFFRATFDPSTIPEHQIKYLSRHIDEVVQMFLADPDREATEIDRCFTTSSLSIANPNPCQHPIEHGPSYAVEQWASKEPDREAVTFGHVVNGVMEVQDAATYSKLNSRANQLARVLLEIGISQDELVGVIMEKSIDLYVSILAVLKLGCGYLPLVPDTPIDRIGTILDDAQVTICISESSVSTSLRQNILANFIDIDLVNLAGYPENNLEVPYNGQHLAYAVFTSGSTGIPKGVLVTQDNLTSNLQYLSSIYPFSSDSRMLQSCSQAFDVSVFEIFFSWHVGMCLCTAQKDDLFHDFEGAINRLEITHLSLTPTVAALVDPMNVPRVEFLVTAGEALTEHVRRRWSGRGLYQGYGPSETTNICTIRALVTCADLINNIGSPFDNTSAFVLDPSNYTILPRGAVGELCFGGTQVFRGYLNRPELNAAKLIEHPSYGRMYRSGDMGIMLPDDSILFTGRSDDQVKIRGHRVELGEITSVVLDNRRVQDCVTLFLPRTNSAKTLVNFWVPTRNTSEHFQALEPNDFRSVTLELYESLSRQLPSYMIPSHLIPISCLPMTAQAKIDKRLLQNLFDDLAEGTLIDATQLHETDDDTDSLSQWEKDVAQVLGRTLRLPSSKIRRTSSFFNLGLDSVSAIRFCNELRKAKLGDFAVPVVLRNPTLAHLASTKEMCPLKEHLTKVPTADSTRVFKPNQVHQILEDYRKRGLHVANILPCTPLQEAMLSSAQSPSGPAYCNVMVFDIKGDASRLQQCWALMVRRHAILRTSFKSTEDPSYAFAQVILEDYDIHWLSQDLQGDVQSRTHEVISDLLDANKPPIYFALIQEEASTKLLLCCHHALYDGIAIAVLLTEIEDCYSGRELLPPISYDVYLQHMLSQNLVKADQYWTVLFNGFEPTSFPSLTSKSPEPQLLATSTTRCLQMPLSEVRKACQSASVSLLSLIQAAWAKLLHFYTGENDICFGNVVSGRTLPGNGLDRLVAPCFNTLPVRVNFNFHKHNSSLMETIHAINIDALVFQLTPLRRIQNIALQDGGRLFDTLVILQQPSAPLDSSIWTLEQDLGGMDLPVVCEVVQDQTEDSIKLVLHYHPLLLSHAEATIVAETFDNSLSSLIQSPQAPANDAIGLPTHLRAESNMDFKRFNDKTNLLHAGFEQIASTRPDHVALDFLHPRGARTIWSFRTLNERANDIAYVLIEDGIQAEDIVPVHMSKSPDFYASVLGILKSGAAFTPVHPDLPEARKRLMLKELNPKLILSSQGSLPHCTEIKVINVATINHCSKGNPMIQDLKETNLAYCLFTSGSTGVPKAVSMEHCAPLQTIESSRTLVPWDSSSRLLQYAAVTFDMCYYDCFLAWTFGFALCTAEQSELLNELPKVINTLEVDLLDLTPSVAESLRQPEVPRVKWLYCIGEAMSPNIVKEWDGACVNSYGPTEAAFCTTIYPVSADVNTSVIGKPFPTTSFAVFPPQGDRPLPLLSIGELYIGGAQLARGYLGRPELTDERFVVKCGQRFYKSGDMVRMLSDGNYEFIGRADDQVKIRGLRVELGEINHVLQVSHPDIATVVTQIMRKDATAREQLVAFVAPHRQVDKDDHVKLQRKLQQTTIERLPSYMIPQFFIFVETIPKSMAGKIDKNALAKIFRDSADANSLPNGTVEPATEHQWTELEQQIRTVLARLSKASQDNITPTTSIYQLGLDSISAVQVAAALRKQGHNVNAADVMKYTTCSGIAKLIDQTAAPELALATRFDYDAFETKHKAMLLEACDIENDDIAAIRPCTPLQNGMVSQFLAKDGAVYMNYLRLQLESDVDLSRIKEAWNTTMKRHGMLRTGFAHVQDTLHPFAMVHYTESAVNLPWDAIANKGSAETAENWIRKLERKALSMLHMPPWGLRVVQDNEYYHLDIAIFHGLFDAHSLQTIFNEVAVVYHRQTLQALAPLDPVIDNILALGDQRTKSGEAFWAQIGKTANPCRFPSLAPLRYNPMPPAVCTKLSKKSLSEMNSGCRSVNITLQAAGIASWLSLLSAYTGESSVTCGVVLSGRNFAAAEHAVFPCINTVPFTSTVTQDKREMLDAVMALNAEVQQHQFTPLNEIQKLMGHPNESFFDTIFAFQKSCNDEIRNPLWDVVDEKATIEYPISIELEHNQRYLEYRLTFLPHIIPREQATQMLDQLDHLMEGFIFPEKSPATDPTFDPTLYSITPAQESCLPSEAELLHELFELTTAKYPQRVAFEFAHSIHDGKYSGRRWTYSELDGEGNRIAHLLISHGVQPGTLVVVCFDKCPEASFAMLGVLKAGCAFVALDPGAPAARQAFIIKDCNAQAVLTLSAQSECFKENVEVPILNLDEVTMRSFPTTKPACGRKINPQDRSYCLYTSGTTGTPKGCELTHENAVQALLAFQRLFAGHWDTESRWLQFAAFHFDVSVLEQFWSWSVGICVVSAPRDLIFEDLANSISALGVTHIDLTPSLAQILHPDDVPSLCKGVFITGGESLKQEILDVWGPRSVIYNGYGPTEATIGVTMYPRVPANGKPSNIGRQFDNVGSFVLQLGSGIPILRGGVGELCVSGKLVGKGYLNRPELTTERFPYLDRFEERVYRTGDLVRVLHDGTFDFLGRADDQVKLRGQRLEVEEINSVIKQSNRDISDVATLVLKHPKQQKEQLVAFTVLGRKSSSQSKILLDDVSGMMKAKEACYEKLPPYMIPTHFVPLTSMPLNVNNKADARRLKEMYEALPVSDLQKLSATAGEQDLSWSKQDQELRRVLMKALGLNEESIGKDTSFFELGMDSISVIGLSRAMKQAGFANVTASLVMRYPTIHRLVTACSINGSAASNRGPIIAARQAITAVQHRHRLTVARSLSLDPTAIEALAPCTPLQQGMIARSLENENGLYFNSFQFKLDDTVNEEKLRGAWESVYLATQILRTIFTNTDDGYVQAVLRGNALSWSLHTVTKNEYTAVSLDKLRRRWLEFNRSDFRRPFEIISVTTPKQKLLIVHIFHGLYDGNSIGLIFKSVWDAYNGRFLDGDAPSFHSALAHGPLRGIEGAKSFWQDHLSSTTFTRLPSLIEESSNKPVIVTRELHDLTAFESTRRKLNVTAQAIAQACWLNVLQHCIRDNVTTGIVVSGRSIDLDNADRIVGPMFNTIPYHDRLRRRDSWASLTQRVHQFNVAAHPYQHTPLRDIVKWCKRSRNQPLFDTLFVYQLAQTEEAWMKNEAWEILDGAPAADYPLAFEIEQKADNKFRVTLVTQGHISTEKTSNELLDRFEKALHQVLRDPTATLELPIQTEGATDNGTSEEKPATDVLKGKTGFEWTDKAIKIREEIASMSGTDIDEVNEMTSIFELGLDSIDAIKMSSKLKKRGVNLPVSDIMRALTIAMMVQNDSNALTQEEQRSSRSNLDLHKRELKNYLERYSLNESDIEEVLPLTPLQESMVAEMVASNYTRYYNYDVLKLNPTTDIGKLRKAWTEVVQASPILRTGFVEVDDPNLDDSFAQVTRQRPHEFWSQIKTDNEPNFPELFEARRSETLRSKLSIPPFHVTFVETPAKSYLILSIAHALYDGWSLGLLHSDVHRAYRKRLTHRQSYEPSLAEIMSTSGPDAATFWKDFLSVAALNSFPRRHSDPSETSGIVHRNQQTSQMPLADVLSFARKGNVSLQSVGQIVFALVSASYTRTLDVTFGSVLSGRDDEQRSQLLFPTMNTVAIRTILHGTGMEMLRYVQDNFAIIKQWQHFPLRKALSLAGVDGRLFESLFIYQKGLDEEQDDSEKLYTSVEGHSDVEYPVCVEMEVVGDELIWRCAVKEEVFSDSEAKQLLGRLDFVLRHITERPEAPIIKITEQGTSVCGLPAFEKDNSRTYNATSDVDGEHHEILPDTETTQKIREVLAAVSKAPQNELTKDMTIFHMGLDSISAIKVSSLLRKQNIVLSVGEMLRAGTVEKMARVVYARTTHSTDDNDNYQITLREALQDMDLACILQRAGIEKANVAEIWPVTAGQLHMLSMWFNTKGGNFYPEFAYELHGDLAFQVLQRSWQALVKASPILRTYFVATGDHRRPYIQMVQQESDAKVTETTACNEDDIANKLEEVASRQPWVHLFASRAPTGWKLRLKIHHALYDGVSLPLLMQQFRDLCNGAATPSSNDTFAKLVARSCGVSALGDRKAFWEKYLKGTKRKNLPQPSTTPKSKTVIFSPALLGASSLEANARKHGVSTQSLVLATYAKLHATMTKAESDGAVVIGIYLANRSLPVEDIASVAVPTVNLLPLRIASPLKHNLVELAVQVQKDLQEISSPTNASASLFEISEWTSIKVDTFVNLLTLPDTEETEKSTRSEKDIEIRSTEKWQDPVCRVSPIEDRSSEVPGELVDEHVNGAYLHAIDIEATIRNGALDVGVFAPTDMLSLERGEKLVDDIRKELESI